MDFMTYPVDWVASQLPLQIDQAKLGVLFVLAYPLGIIFSKIQGAQARYIFGLVFGLYFQWTVYKENILHTLFATAMTYILALVYGRKCVKPVLIFAAVYCSIYHIYRMLSNPGVWRINISFALMMCVCKLTAFAWAYQDGAKSKLELSADQEYRKIEKLPSVLEFFSYIYFYPSTLIGPFFDFKDYQNLVTRQGPYQSVPRTQACLWGVQSMIFGLAVALEEMLLIKRFNAAETITDEFMEKSFGYRIVYYLIAGHVLRFKYYSGFYMGQSGVDTCGLSYSGYVDGKHVFDRVLTTHRFTEATTSARSALERWNASTQVWLKRYIYNRVLDKQQLEKQRQNPMVASCITFLVAAAWHGFYPSYFLTFFGIWAAVEAAKSMYKARPKFQWVPKPIAIVSRYLFTLFIINFLTIGHVNLEWSKCLKSYASVYYLPLIMNLGMIFFLSITGLAKSSKASRAKGVSKTVEKTQEILNEGKVEDGLRRKFAKSRELENEKIFKDEINKNATQMDIDRKRE